MGAASTEQQQRSSPQAGASGQSDSTEAPGRSTGTPHARSGSDTRTATAPSSPGGSELTGRVEKFDHTSKTFTISGTTVKVDESTEVTKDGRKAALTDVQEGDQVRASMSGSGDAATARSIEVTSSGAATSGSSPSTGSQPAGRGGAMGPGTGTGQGDTTGTTSGTGTGSTGGTTDPSSTGSSGSGR
jgi:hypothetical protein